MRTVAIDSDFGNLYSLEINISNAAAFVYSRFSAYVY